MRLKKIHFEVTNRCNAACPICPRTGIYNGESAAMKNWGYHEMPFELFQDILLSKACITLEKLLYCGNFGDPIIHPQILDMWKFAGDLGIMQSVDTNASLRSEAFWSEAGKIPKLEVCFSLDGLADTNHIYRQNTDFDKIIRNAKAFISSGGVATWQFIVFGHNEHQVEEAKQMAKDIGFKHFKTKATSRQLDTERDYKKTSKSEIKSINISSVKNKKYATETLDHSEFIAPDAKITCQAFKVRRDVYIAADGHVLPCCWVGKDFVINHYPGSYPLKKNDKDRDGMYAKLMESPAKIDLNKYSFDEVFDSYVNSMDFFEEQWANKTISICNQKCGNGRTNKVSWDDL